MSPARSVPLHRIAVTPGPVATLVLGLGRALVIWDMRRRSRRALAALPPDRLADIGLTPREAAREARTPFWKG